jgi:hypothetical protein
MVYDLTQIFYCLDGPLEALEPVVAGLLVLGQIDQIGNVVDIAVIEQGTHYKLV